LKYNLSIYLLVLVIHSLDGATAALHSLYL